MTRCAILLGPLLVAVSLPAVAEPIATFRPPLTWLFYGPEKLVMAEKPDGGPGGGAWTEVTYQPNTAANLRPERPVSLQPGSRLKVWVKGNGTEDVLCLYLFGGDGHRAFNVPLNETGWREVAFDVSEDFGEDPWRWETPRRFDLTGVRELKLYALPQATAKAPPVGLGDITLEPPTKGDQPAVLLATCSPDFGDPAKTYRIVPHLQAAGYETRVSCIYELGSATYLAADQLTRYNAVILLDLPQAEKGGYPRNFARVSEVLHEYVDQGGGLLFTAIPSGWNNIMPTINQFLAPWGAKCLDEQVVDPENLVQSDAWFARYPFCWTDNVAPHAVTQGVKGTWYPGKAWRADGILTTVGFTVDGNWQLLVRGRETARTVRAKGDDLVTQPALSIASAPPLFAARQVGKGRVGLLPIYPSFLTGGCDHPAWRSMVWDGSAKGLKSDMKTLFLNSIRWLAEPSVQAKVFGGYLAPKGPADYRPPHERPIPLDWGKARFAPPQHNDYLVLIGLQSNLSGGGAGPAELLTAAKAAGYQVAVFAEALPGMSADKWRQLSDACAKTSGPDFLGLPGLRLRDPQGNSYLLFGTFDWPNEEWYRKCVNEKGQVIDTYALYAKVSQWRHVAIHSLGKGANPALHLRHYSCVAVFTYEGDKLIDDAYQDYLLLEENCYYPIPIAVHFVSTVEGVARAKAGWQTRLWATSLARARDLLDGGKAGESYFWNPKPTYLSSGPRLLDWQELNMNSWRANAPGTDRWQFRFALESEAPLSEVRVMDGTRLFRCFRPNTPSFTLEHTGHHGKQNQFTLRARDARGGELISSHLKTHTMEHVFFICGDRQNSLGPGSWGYQPWPAQYGTAPDIDISELFPPHWDGGAPGFSSFCEATLQPQPGFDVDKENDLGMLASSKRTLMASRDCTITEEVGDGKFRDRDDWGDCRPTPSLLPRRFITDQVRKYHYRVLPGTTGFLLAEGTVRALADAPVPPDPQGNPVCLYQFGDHGGKNGELQYFAFTASDGRRVVRHTPEGVAPFTCRDSAKQGDYFTTFPRRLGAPVLFPLTPVNYSLWGAPNIFGMTFGAAVPSGKVAKGDTWRYRLLFACFAPKPEEMNEAAEEIRVQYGLVGPPGYPCSVKHGELLSTVYELRLKAAEGAATVEVGRASLAGALPIVVEGLNERWSAVIAEGEAARFIGVSEGRGYAVADVRDQGHTLFVGHPVRCGDPNVCLELIDWSLDRATVEAHNPTEQPIKTWIAASPACAFVPQAKAEVALDPGVSKRVELRRG